MKEGQELVKEVKVLSVFDKFEADIKVFEEVNADLDFDIESYEGEIECKTYLKKLRKVYNGIEKLRKSTKAEFIASPSLPHPGKKSD